MAKNRARAGKLILTKIAISRIVRPVGRQGARKASEMYYICVVKPASLHFKRRLAGLTTHNQVIVTDTARAAALALTRALRARRARPPEVPEKALFSCFAAARAACVSTWLGERLLCGRRARRTLVRAIPVNNQPNPITNLLRSPSPVEYESRAARFS